MQLIVYLDPKGLVKVDLSANSPGTEEVHRFFESLRPAIEQLGIAAQEAGREIASGEADSQITYGDVIAKS